MKTNLNDVVYWGASENGTGPYTGPQIKGKKPAELIKNGELTPENITTEEKEVVYNDILLALTPTKELLSKKVALISSDKDMVQKLVLQQYKLAMQGIKKEYSGAKKIDKDRTLDFLSTIQILNESGFDLNNLEFQTQDSEKIGVTQLLENFEKKSRGAQGLIPDPTNFKNRYTPDVSKGKNNWPDVFAKNLRTTVNEKAQTNNQNEGQQLEQSEKEMLISKIKEQQAIIEAQQAEIAELQANQKTKEDGEIINE